MTCPHCNAEIREESNFCIYCGTAVGPQSPQYAEPRRLNSTKVLGDTFKLCIRHFGILCLVGLIVMGIPAIINICQVSVQGMNESPFAVADLTALNVGLGLWFLALLANCYVWIVAIRQSLHIARGGTGLQKGLLFPPLFTLLNMIGLMFIVTVIGSALAFSLAVLSLFVNFGGFPSGFTAVLGGFALVITAFVLWFSTRFWLAQYFLVDQNTDCFDALSQAWEASAGNFRALFGMIILFMCPIFCWTFLCFSFAEAWSEEIEMMETVHGILLFSAGLAPLALLTWLSSALAYLQLTEHANDLK